MATRLFLAFFLKSSLKTDKSSWVCSHKPSLLLKDSPLPKNTLVSLCQLVLPVTPCLQLRHPVACGLRLMWFLRTVTPFWVTLEILPHLISIFSGRGPELCRMQQQEFILGLSVTCYDWQALSLLPFPRHKPNALCPCCSYLFSSRQSDRERDTTNWKLLPELCEIPRTGA